MIEGGNQTLTYGTEKADTLYGGAGDDDTRAQ